MQQINKITQDNSTNYSSNETIDAKTTNSEWDYIKDLTDAKTSNSEWDYIKELVDENEHDYFLGKIHKLEQEGRDITLNINKMLETRNKLKLEGLHFYKEVCIYGEFLTIYKQLGVPKNIQGFYITFNGAYAIPYKDFYKLKIGDGLLFEELLEEHNINCYK